MATTPDGPTAPDLQDFSELLGGFLFEADADLTITRTAGAFPHGLGEERELTGAPLHALVRALSDGAARHAITSLIDRRQKISRLRYNQGPVAEGGDEYEISVQPLFAGADFTGLRGIISPVPRRPRADIVRESRSDLLSSVSHELRTPLNAILGFAEIIRGELLGPLGARQYHDYMADIQASGRHLLQMVDDILDIARMEGGDLALRADAVDVGAAVDSCLNIHAEALAEKGVRLEAKIQEGLPRVWGDAHAIRQMLLNIMANAEAFVESGGRITVSAHREENGALHISVADTGVGIDPDHLEYVLLPFIQPDHRLARGHGGAGLGLPITRALMDLHEGHIDIESKVGVGTEVTLVFPARRLVAAGPDDRRMAG